LNKWITNNEKLIVMKTQRPSENKKNTLVLVLVSIRGNMSLILHNDILD